MNELFNAILYILTPWPFFWVLVGVVSGIFFGAIPGLSGGMLIVLVMPLTFYMDSTFALIMMIGIYVGSVSGGLISATLLRMPGTPSSIMTTFDGYPMAQAGKPLRALGLGISSSLFGGLVAGFFLVVLSPPLSRWATTFGPWEYFSLVLMALVLIATISHGSMIKGLLAGAIGLMAAMPGLNESDGQLRLTFGINQMDAGFGLLPVLLGVFVMSQIIKDSLEIERKSVSLSLGSGSAFLRLGDLRRHWVNILRSSVIGTWIGILPGVGASIASMVAYGVARSVSKTPEKFGTGCEEGIVASESANNANVGGALIPLVTLGIPGSPMDAFLLGALILHNIQPGPLLFQTNGAFVWAMIAAYLVSNIMMYLVMASTLRLTARVINVNRAYLLPVVFLFCVIGVFALSSRMFDVWVVIGFGVVGFLMERIGIPLGPFVIGFVLARVLEGEVRSGLMSSGGTYLPLITRPIALTFTIVSILVLVYPLIAQWRRHRRVGKPNADGPEPKSEPGNRNSDKT